MKRKIHRCLVQALSLKSDFHTKLMKNLYRTTVDVAKNIQGIENFDNMSYGINDLAEQEILELRTLSRIELPKVTIL